MLSDPDGTFDAQTKLARASSMLLIAAGSGESLAVGHHWAALMQLGA